MVIVPQVSYRLIQKKYRKELNLMFSATPGAELSVANPLPPMVAGPPLPLDVNQPLSAMAPHDDGTNTYKSNVTHT